MNASLISGVGNVAISGNDLFVLGGGGGDRVSEYTTSGAVVSVPLFYDFNSLLSIAVSGNDVFVGNFNRYNTTTVGEYTTSGATVNASLISGNIGPVVILENDLFVLTGNGVAEYDTSGDLINASLISGLNQPTAFAIWGNDLFIACLNGGGPNSTNGTVGEYTTSGATVNASLISGLSEPIKHNVINNCIY